MKTKTKRIAAIATVALVAFMGGRMTGSSPIRDSDKPAATTDTESTSWTCSMHPQIIQPEPGDCPICGMDLIPLDNNASDEEGPRTMSMSESARALADIQTTLVRREYPAAEIRLVGKLGYDETRSKALTARFPARIDELFVNYDGIRVNEGEHLARVYSTITQASREKLRLWDLLPQQIEGIIERGEATDNFILKAPIGGIVVEKKVKEGDYIKTGQTLFHIVDLSTLWLSLEAYESDLPWLRVGQTLTFSVEAMPGEIFNGRIAFISPEVNRQTRTSLIRVNVDNANGQLKPGMFAKGIVKVKMAEGGRVFAPELAGKWISPMHPEIMKDEPGTCDVCGMDLVRAEDLGYAVVTEADAPLVIPSTAALRTGKRAVVYIETPNREHPTFEGREVVLGPRAGDRLIVLEGLQKGDRVVSHGAFKIDSALQIQAKPSMMNPKGGGPVPGHDHGSQTDMTGETAMDITSSPPLELTADQVKDLVAPYLAMQSALASDDLEGAKAAARSMMKVTGHSGPLGELMHTMLNAETLDAIRRPHFEALSNAIISAAKQHPGTAGELLIMHCPMVYEDRGADWLQRGEPLRNPYFGEMMLRCGEVTETIN
jgi:Cu(I)/Ag(I) efflux system membrane fusion protein